MRIVFANKFARVTGGADRNCLALSQELEIRGHQVSLLSTSDPNNEAQTGAFVSPTVLHANRDALSVTQRASVAGHALWNPAASAAMLQLISDFRPDIVHVHKLYPQLSVAPVAIARRAGLPVVQTLHDYELLSASYLDAKGGWVDHDETRPSYRALNTATFPIRRIYHRGRVDEFISCSNFLAARYRTDGISSTVLPYFVEPVDRRRLPSFADRSGAAFVGRLNESKGVLDVLDLARRAPRIPVTVAGYGPLAGAVAAEAARLPNLRFAGFADHAEVLEIFRDARVALMPSRWEEPGGISALEAMSMGTPVVAYRRGGLAEYVEDAAGGSAVPMDSDALVAATSQLHNERPAWSTASENALSGIQDRHTPSGYTDRVLAIYEALLN